MKRILFVIIASIFISCADNHHDCCMNIVADFAIAIKDVEGNNLLNTPEYPFNGIQSQYYRNGLLQNYQSPALIEDGENTRIKVYLNIEEGGAFPITYVKWNNTDTDTLKAHFNRTSNSIILDQIWINDVEVNLSEPGYFHTLLK